MILFPVAWPFLALYLVLRCWRVTLPLLVVLGLAALVYWLPLIGWPMIGAILLITAWVLRIQRADEAYAERERLHAGH